MRHRLGVSTGKPMDFLTRCLMTDGRGMLDWIVACCFWIFTEDIDNRPWEEQSKLYRLLVGSCGIIRASLI
ncbi:hypothetical protein VNO77_09584 [Canavalia gladiata]|uniref:Uncharacterized protein n=1 Tax=Canavalia gladiata TaxID=3824 RepID=A0AAN9M9C9_CANGL